VFLLLLLLLPLQVESDVYERVYQKCQNERMAQHRTYTWGNRCGLQGFLLESPCLTSFLWLLHVALLWMHAGVQQFVRMICKLMLMLGRFPSS
jgi:hypothetical protein